MLSGAVVSLTGGPGSGLFAATGKLARLGTSITGGGHLGPLRIGLLLFLLDLLRPRRHFADGLGRCGQGSHVENAERGWSRGRCISRPCEQRAAQNEQDDCRRAA